MTNQISYKEVHGDLIDVYLGKKRTGSIIRIAGGFCYKTKGSLNYGEVFPTTELCKKSLEI